jgi:hypothetical protein
VVAFREERQRERDEKRGAFEGRLLKAQSMAG